MTPVQWVLLAAAAAIIVASLYGLIWWPRLRHHVVSLMGASLLLLAYWFPWPTPIEIQVLASRLAFTRHSPLDIDGQVYLKKLIVSCSGASLRHEAVVIRDLVNRRSQPLAGARRLTGLQAAGGQWEIVPEGRDLYAVTMTYPAASATMSWHLDVHAKGGEVFVFLPLEGLQRITLENVDQYSLHARGSRLDFGGKGLASLESLNRVNVAARLGTAAVIELPPGGCQSGGYFEISAAQAKKETGEKNKLAFRSSGYQISDLKVSGVKEVTRLVQGKLSKVDDIGLDGFRESGAIKELRSSELTLSPEGISASVKISGTRSVFSFLFEEKNIIGVMLTLALFWAGLVATSGLRIKED